MFEGLSERMQGVFKELRGEGHLTEFHLEQALRQIRLSLLEADVALPVVKAFTERVKERAVGAKVTQQLSPAQEVTRIVRDELMALLGGEAADVVLTGKPAVIALVGLQGSGKTTSAAKLARHSEDTRPVSAHRRGGPRSPRGRGAARDARGARSACRSSSREAGRTRSRSRATDFAKRGRPGETRSSSTRPDGSTSTTS